VALRVQYPKNQQPDYSFKTKTTPKQQQQEPHPSSLTVVAIMRGKSSRKSTLDIVQADEIDTAFCETLAQTGDIPLYGNPLTNQAVRRYLFVKAFQGDATKDRRLPMIYVAFIVKDPPADVMEVHGKTAAQMGGPLSLKPRAMPWMVHVWCLSRNGSATNSKFSVSRWESAVPDEET
jgi:hypothetical protein